MLVLQNGRPLSLTWEQEHVPAILECWYPGEKGGRAVAEVLFGKTAPSGRLPMSFPKSVGQVPCNYNRMPGGGRRYVETDWNPLYPFGYGLTYTSFPTVIWKSMQKIYARPTWKWALRRRFLLR